MMRSPLILRLNPMCHPFTQMNFILCIVYFWVHPFCSFALVTSPVLPVAVPYSFLSEHPLRFSHQNHFVNTFSGWVIGISPTSQKENPPRLDGFSVIIGGEENLNGCIPWFNPLKSPFWRWICLFLGGCLIVGLKFHREGGLGSLKDPEREGSNNGRSLCFEDCWR